MIVFGYTRFASQTEEHRAAERLRNRMLAEICGITHPQIRRLPGGKPVLTEREDVHFSVSHTKGVAVCALSFPGAGNVGAFMTLDSSEIAPKLGVDVEIIRDAQETERLRRIAARFFPADLRERIALLSDDAYPKAFAKIWTACESAVKRDGRGFGKGFSTLSFEKLQMPQWTMQCGGEEYAICVAWRGKTEEIQNERV